MQGDFLLYRKECSKVLATGNASCCWFESSLGGLIAFLSSNFKRRFKALHLAGGMGSLLPILEALQLPRSERSRIVKDL